MHVVALCSQKGRSGKTTLSGHLAVQAELAGASPVALIDTEGRSATEIARLWEYLAGQLERQERQRVFHQPTALGFGRRATL